MVKAREVSGTRVARKTVLWRQDLDYSRIRDPLEIVHFEKGSREESHHWTQEGIRDLQRETDASVGHAKMTHHSTYSDLKSLKIPISEDCLFLS